MIRPTDELEAFKRRYAREEVSKLSYLDALALFEALWVEAAALSPDSPGDCRADIHADLAVARAVNGLPPQS